MPATGKRGILEWSADRDKIMTVHLYSTPQSSLPYAAPDDGVVIRSERDALDLLAACGVLRCSRLLLTQTQLAPAFFDLKTGLAGAVLQKFVNYALQVAVVLDPDADLSARFRELIHDHRRSRHLRFFTDRASAEVWLTDPTQGMRNG